MEENEEEHRTRLAGMTKGLTEAGHCWAEKGRLQSTIQRLEGLVQSRQALLDKAEWGLESLKICSDQQEER